MGLSSLRINPNLKQHVFVVGDEKTPIIILDDFLIDTSEIIANAHYDVNFNDADTYYPGIRADIPKHYFNLVLNALNKSLPVHDNLVLKKQPRGCQGVKHLLV